MKSMPAIETPASELRSAPRFALMLRAGKLVSDQGEFLCILRDVSQTGIKAKLFHPLPTGRKFFLEIANGERFRLEPVWEEDGHAGFRFLDDSIDIHALVEENSPHPRRQIRLRLQPPLPIMIVADGISRPASLLNLSQNGVAIEIDGPLALRLPVQVEATGIGRAHGRVRWRRGNLHGIVFQEGFRMDELARLIVRIQPEAAQIAAAGAAQSATAVNR